jgi:hypothetical protein
MKSFKVLFVLLLLGGFFSTNANAQALVVKDNVFTLDDYPSFHSQEVVTPDGTINLRVHLQLPLDHFLVAHAIYLGGKYIYTTTVITDNGAIPIEVTIYFNGKVKVNGHLEP